MAENQNSITPAQRRNLIQHIDEKREPVPRRCSGSRMT
jgi:hypothetical protein